MKQRWITAGKVLISVALLLLLARSLPLGQVTRILWQVPFSAWLMNTALIGLATAIGAYRWHLASGYLIPLRTCLSYYWMGIFYSYVLPGSLAGDVARTAVLATQQPEHRTLTLPVSVLLDRLGGLITTVLVLAIALSAQLWSKAPSALILGAMAVLLTSVVGFPLIAIRLCSGLSKPAWLPASVRSRFLQVAESLRNVPLCQWLVILALSGLIHAVTCGSYAWSAKVTGVPGELWRIGLYYAVFNLVVLLPVTIAGVGLREQSAVWLLGQNGSGTASVALSWMVLSTTVVHVLIGAALHLFVGHRKAAPTKSDVAPPSPTTRPKAG